MRISIILVFAGVTLFLATPSVFSYLHLSDKYAIATSELEKSQLLSAGEAIIASDMWHGTGAKIGSLLMQIGALIISILMLKNNVFTKLTAYIGILTHGLDLSHILIGFFLPNWRGNNNGNSWNIISYMVPINRAKTLSIKQKS